MSRVALLIGNNNYKHLPKLQTAISDVHAVSELIRKAGFRVTEISDASRREMGRELNRFSEELRNAAVGLFWFAGHGVQFANRNFLLPVELEIEDASDLEDEAFDLDKVLSRMSRSQAQPLLLFIDACRIDGSHYFRTYHRGIGLATGLATLATPPDGFMVIFSAGAGQVALDRLGPHDDAPYSLFTRELLPLLGSPGLSISEAVKRARRAIRDKAACVGSVQGPAIYDQTDIDFCLVPPQSIGGLGGPPEAIRAPIENTTQAIGPLLDEAAWSSIEIGINRGAGASVSFHAAASHELTFQQFLDDVYWAANRYGEPLDEYTYGNTEQSWLLLTV